MSQYTISEITGKNEWESKFGPMVTYKLIVSGPDHNGPADLSQKPSTAAPTVGQSIEGTLDKSNPKFPPKLKKAQQQQGGGGGRPKANEDEIRKAVAYKGAVDLTVALIATGSDRSPEADIERFFRHGLGLLEGKQVAKAPDPGSRAAITRGDVNAAYQKYLQRLSLNGTAQEKARERFELYKTSLGLSDAEHASQEQLGAVVDWLNEQKA